MKRYDEIPRVDVAYTDRPGAYAILRRGGQILLTRQDRPAPEIQLPGGGIDPGEHPLPALHREVREETGWGMQVLRRVGAYQRFTYMPEYDLWAHKICHIYLCQPTLAVPVPIETGHTPVWMSLQSAARELTNAGDRDFLVRAIWGR